jgi:hypothetical protein
VKTWRVLLLMLLALLLPVRGAMAAAMLCPPGGHGHAVAQALAAQPVHHHAGHEHAGQHAGQNLHQHHHPEAPADTPDAHAGDTHSSSCHVCASFCSMTPMPSDIPALPQPALVSSMSFPTWAAPEPLFLSDGQERPPRTI